MLFKPSRLRLLPREQLIKTSEVDHADWNYRPVLGAVSRRRFELVLKLLPTTLTSSLLEIGYGSGIFVPELVKHAKFVFGADVHPYATQVEVSLAKIGVNATLSTAPAESLPYETNAFDAIVCISALEFVLNIRAAVNELRRVLHPGGSLIVVTPSSDRRLDFALRVLTGESAKVDFDDRRAAVLPTLSQVFRKDEQATFPSIPIPGIPVIYTAARYRHR